MLNFEFFFLWENLTDIILLHLTSYDSLKNDFYSDSNNLSINLFSIFFSFSTGHAFETLYVQQTETKSITRALNYHK